MGTPRAFWSNTTHDWGSGVHVDHLTHIRQRPATFAPGGVPHLILEVVAHAAVEAEGRSSTSGRTGLCPRSARCRPTNCYGSPCPGRLGDEPTDGHWWTYAPLRFDDYHA
ncbi:hypothetical protein [Nonomuraea cavernae]|uniref:Uncharacterized protein n=1 Tax=Nonomuraea cavernae TaxID=2045107 RepID=A0A917YPU7_9ACTN|nr:hypothetical protein [Nonomuraea cavernae]MCA2183958.1 hypothetical protein [Nonomuraea cavernae]GGO61895.1 hypothetical protein GCM10012289_05220 [Nonomuraea cavernae]